MPPRPEQRRRRFIPEPRVSGVSRATLGARWRNPPNPERVPHGDTPSCSTASGLGGLAGDRRPRVALRGCAAPLTLGSGLEPFQGTGTGPRRAGGSMQPGEHWQIPARRDQWHPEHTEAKGITADSGCRKPSFAGRALAGRGHARSASTVTRLDRRPGGVSCSDPVGPGRRGNHGTSSRPP